jgi:hypothetical protein
MKESRPSFAICIIVVITATPQLSPPSFTTGNFIASHRIIDLLSFIIIWSKLCITMSSSQDSLDKNQRKHSTEDWMQVLDNFLDHDHHQQEGEGHEAGEAGQDGEELNHNHNHHHYHHNLQQNFQTHLSHPPRSLFHHHDSRNESTNGQEASSRAAPTKEHPREKISSNHSTASYTDDNVDLEGLEEGASATSEDKKAQIRSERKRTREKQRRSDVNSQFALLTDILKRVEDYDIDSDVSDDEEDGETKKRKVKSVGMVNVPPSNRVDLIARTVAIMERLHKVNRSLRQNVKSLRKTVKKCSSSFYDSGGDDLKKTGGMNVGGSVHGMGGYGGSGVMMNNGSNFPGMMMMMAPPTMMGQTTQHGDGQQVS